MSKETKALLTVISHIKMRSRDIREASWAKQCYYVLTNTTPEDWSIVLHNLLG